jgi:hypothetical protein
MNVRSANHSNGVVKLVISASVSFNQPFLFLSAISFPFSKMGTRSKLLIVRKHKPNIHLWMHWDGYWNGVGDDICNQLKELLEKYSMETILEMVNALDLEDDEDGQDFNPKDLIAFLEGTTDYLNDTCNDVEYEYTLNFDHQIFYGRGYDREYEKKVNRVNRSVSFEQIRSGIKISDFVIPSVPEIVSVDRIVEIFINLPKDMRREAFEKICDLHSYMTH